MLSGEHLLIVEEEFLIALDIQRVIEGAHAARTVFARNFTEAAALADRFSEFDLAIVTPPRDGSADQQVADKLAAAGPAVVVCSAAQVNLAGNLHGSEIVYKPFADEDLLTACRRALEKRGRG
jgi:DNA-binding NtrC family response regulator